MSQFLVSLLATLGVGSVVAAWISRTVAIGNHRQLWINALRDDLAAYLRDLDATHIAFGRRNREADTPEEHLRRVQKFDDARSSVLFAYWRIVLRLNRTEHAHIELQRELFGLLTIQDEVPNQDKISHVMDLARRVLKREWEVTKWGWFAERKLMSNARRWVVVVTLMLVASGFGVYFVECASLPMVDGAPSPRLIFPFWTEQGPLVTAGVPKANLQVGLYAREFREPIQAAIGGILLPVLLLSSAVLLALGGQQSKPSAAVGGGLAQVEP